MPDIRTVLDYAQLPLNPPEELIDLLNTKFNLELEDIDPVNQEGGQTEETREKEILSLVDSLASDASLASEEEVALLCHLHRNEKETDIWFDDISDTGGEFYSTGKIIKQGTAEYAVVYEPSIKRAFNEYVEDYVKSIVLPEIPERYRIYFDIGKFADDLEIEGYGQMSSYDGNYSEVTIGKEMWLVFRLN